MTEQELKLKKKYKIKIIIKAILIFCLAIILILMASRVINFGTTIKQTADVASKPVIYFYPETQTDINVKLDLDGKLTTSYPKYNNEWNLTAIPGQNIIVNGKEYNYLYWEGDYNNETDFSTGYCVKREDSAKFLEETLPQLGLNNKEANEFIVYWLPLLEQNKYNIISFDNTDYCNKAKLNITPQPDNLIRVYMTFYGSDEPINIQNPEIITPNRNGYTVVEWGGTQIKNN